MPIHESDIYDEACRLRDMAESEIQRRNAISRSYYGLYHTAYNYMQTLPTAHLNTCNGEKGGSHKQLRDCYVAASKEVLANKKFFYQEVAKILRTSHFKRRDADYKLDMKITKDALEEQFIDCARGISLIEKIKELSPS